MPWWDLRSVFVFKNFRCFSQSQNGLSQRLETSAGFSQLFRPLIAHKKHQQGRMRDAQPGSHTVSVRSHGVTVASYTVRSHGITVARTHLNDWMILILLLGIVVLLNVIHPFYRFVGKDMMEDLKYPLKSNTVPFWAVPVYAVLLPMVVFLLIYFRRRDVYDLHHAILGLLFSVVVTAVITGAIKDAVGRPRPDFFWRCFPDGKEVYDKWGDVVCHGDKNVVREGHKSFPSGHTSLSFAGLGFLSLYLSGKIQVFDCRGHVAKLCLVLLPLLLASLVAISRVDDYWHHWQDVFAGGLIGLVVATLCYLQFFPPPYNDQGWATYAYSRMLEESQGAVETSNGENANANNTCNAEVQIGSQPNHRNNNTFTGISLSGDSGPTVEDLESGRR
ncbi:lipid phosphate phosphatase 2-like isoform X1 [Solanum pennellii]|uniref:Lipid phosphate phosphatase 2-like isoform X1 n=2 Tax=Solanum pennellii TaxID=28526 RepID=A0ABM1FY11_SOLPN|nr:lipid phosphate phosphatase 2-like isoform X1 [Solanum pennellii]